MAIEIPSEILQAGLTEDDCLVELAVHLYAEKKISYGPALRLSRLNRFAFDKALADHGVSLYTVADLHDDVAALSELTGR